MQTRDFRLSTECHILHYPEEGLSIAYFPLKSLAISINPAALQILARLKQTSQYSAQPDEMDFLKSLESMLLVNQQPDGSFDTIARDSPTPTNVMLLLSERCNLRCVYCYANAGISGRDMPLTVAHAAVDTILANASKMGHRSIRIDFHGGGEPTQNWRSLVGSLEYAQQQCQQAGLRLRSGICSNGVISADQARWLAQNIDEITISLDGDPDTQNRQRPSHDGSQSYSHVADTLDLLRRLGKKYAIRSTITQDSVCRLDKLFQFIATRFQPANFTFEPLFLCGRCLPGQVSSPDSLLFISMAKTIAKMASFYKVPASYSGGKLFFLGSRFCGVAGNNFFITPSGDVTSCIEVSQRQDPRSQIFMYGNYQADSHRFVFDNEIYQKLCSLNVHNYDSCQQCFAKWHCSGDCPAKVPDIHDILGKRNPDRCQINQQITKEQILAEFKRPGLAQNSRHIAKKTLF